MNEYGQAQTCSPCNVFDEKAVNQLNLYAQIYADALGPGRLVFLQKNE